MLQASQVSFPCPNLEVEVVLTVSLRGGMLR
ncbi:MAG: hypothetical protein QOJ42_6344 [Acidobacteriaceae bacterium]|nr:hypothetical protein [Acidobacteriaceae bacterium]